jgi:hypothetical protein
MGYTHYWYRPDIIANGAFRAIRMDFEQLILPLSDLGVELADGLGKGLPLIRDDIICFNGLQDCGHPPNEDLTIPFPSEHARGIGPNAAAIDGDLFGWAVTIKHRCCNGKCDYETFRFTQTVIAEASLQPNRQGFYFEFVKTAFRPYDIAVTAALLIAKRHLRDQLIVHSDGRDTQWADARDLCQRVLGYGQRFGITEKRVPQEAGDVAVRTLTETAPPVS